MRLPFILCLLFIITTCSAQQVNNNRIDYRAKCGLGSFAIDEADELAKYNGNLTKYFSKHINWKKLEHVSGLIILDVTIDTIGRACISGYTNRTINSNYQVLNLWLEQIVNNMPGWIPAKKNGIPVNTTTQLAVYSAVDGHKDLEVDYYRSFSQKNERLKITPRPTAIMPADWDELNRNK
jgi:hypothetical protein